MNKFFWLVTLVIAFLMGYVAHQEPYYAEEPKVAVDCSEKSSSSSDSSSIESSNSSITSSTSASVHSSSIKSTVHTTESFSGELISDEAIDKILPEPYADILKSNHGEGRALYKSYAEASQIDDWDKSAQSTLMKAIQNTSHAKNLLLEAVICKNHTCELRLLEKKSGTWTETLAELVQQDHWEFGKIHSFGRPANHSTQYATAYLVLLSKK